MSFPKKTSNAGACLSIALNHTSNAGVVALAPMHALCEGGGKVGMGWFSASFLSCSDSAKSGGMNNFFILDQIFYKKESAKRCQFFGLIIHP